MVYNKYWKQTLCCPIYEKVFSTVSVNFYLVAKEWFEVQKQLENKLLFLWLFINSEPYGDRTSFFPEAQRHCLLSYYANLYFGTKLKLVFTLETVQKKWVEALVLRSCSFRDYQNLNKLFDNYLLIYISHE